MDAEGNNQQNEYRGESATVVALDRRDDEEVVLRFLIDEVSWDVHAREVRLTKDLAEQLMQMLADELKESSQGFHYGSQPTQAFV